MAKKIGELLVQEGLVTIDQLNRALDEQRQAENASGLPW